MAASPDELARVASLYALGLDVSGREERFERVARIAQQLLDAPIAMVNMLSADQQWGKACIGIGGSDMPRIESFCNETILEDRTLVIEDAEADERYTRYLSPDHGVRAYLGHPVHAPEGYRIGTLCIADRVPRAWGPQAVAMLRDLAAWVDLEVGWASLRDAAERERAAEVRLRTVIDSAAEGVVTLDPEGRVVLANPAALEILGYDTDELVGRVLHDLAHHTHPDGSPYPRHECPSHRTLSGGVSHRLLEEVYWRKDGTPAPVDLSSTPIRDGARITGAVVIFRDATERRELERMKTEFISSVSHELRTPLTAIAGYLEDVLEDDEGTLTAMQREDLEVVQRNAGRLHALIDDLLLLSRMQAGRLDFAAAPVPVHDMLSHLVEDLAPAARAADLRIAAAVEPALAVGDASRLQQCFANLLSNALKFGRPGTEVSLVARPAADGVEVAVTDRGPGIPPDEVERLGQRFFRASTAGAVEGTGLGLTITREIVERHGGRLEVESRLGEGSTFRIVLPAFKEDGA